MTEPYRDMKFNIEVQCWQNVTGKEYRFFDSFWGPHGEAGPGQWVAMDNAGFKIAVDDREFQERFKKLEEKEVSMTD